MAKRGPNEPWPMDGMQAAVIERFQGKPEFQNLSQKKQQKLLLRLTNNIAKEIRKDLLKRAPKMLARRRKAQAGFEARNMRRWRKAVDLFETLWVCCEEMGRNFNQYFRPEAVQTEDFAFEALTAIHARSLLVGEEMLCLMKGGFADAALSRWRTLHEFSVVANLITQEGQDLALRYLAHADVQATKDADPETLANDPELQVVKARADFGLARFGGDLKRRYGWACTLIGKKQPTFEDLEKKADKTEGRSFYQYASQHIHSNHRAHDELLAMSESQETILLVGSSNSGMVGPLTLASMTLAEITVLYLNSRPNFDRAIFTAVLIKMAGRMNKLASRVEKATSKAAQKRKARKDARAAA